MNDVAPALHWSPLPGVDAAGLDAVVITHAHLAR